MQYSRYGWIVYMCFCLVVPTALVFAAAPAAIPELNTSLLVDQTEILNDSEREALSNRLLAIQNSGGAQVAILISSGIHGEPLSDFSLRVAETWKLGRAGRDDGLLILVIPKDLSARIEVGYGLEGAVPDARVSQWLDDLMPAIRHQKLADGLNDLLDQVEAVLPLTEAKPDSEQQDNLFDQHPEWKIPFVLIVFSPFAIFPLFMGYWGSLASGPLLAAFMGGAALALWDSQTMAFAVAGAAFPLPFLWGLNGLNSKHLKSWQRYGKAFGNLVAVLMFFIVITLFVGIALPKAGIKDVWAVVPAGIFATALAAFLFPGKPAQYLVVFLRSAMHFVFFFILVLIVLKPFIPDSVDIAFVIAAAITTCVAIGLYLDSRETAHANSTKVTGFRWSLFFVGIALLIALPFGIMALVMSVASDDMIQAVTGGGSVTAILWAAARLGLFTAVKVGLGGLFGGGGAGRSD